LRPVGGLPKFGHIDQQAVHHRIDQRLWTAHLVVADSEVAQRVAAAAGLEGWVGAYFHDDFRLGVGDGHQVTAEVAWLP